MSRTGTQRVVFTAVLVTLCAAATAQTPPNDDIHRALFPSEPEATEPHSREEPTITDGLEVRVIVYRVSPDGAEAAASDTTVRVTTVVPPTMPNTFSKRRSRCE